MSDWKKSSNQLEDGNYNELAKDIIKKELLAKLEKRLMENDPVIINAIRTLINESDNVEQAKKESKQKPKELSEPY